MQNTSGRKRSAGNEGIKPGKCQQRKSGHIIMKDRKLEIRFGKKYINVLNAGLWEYLIILSILMTIILVICLKK